MAGMIEVRDVRQVPGEARRRWFTSDELDLIVWCDAAGVPIAFQFCYDKPRAEHALTWRPELGFHHMAVDDGEGVDFKWKGTPILVPDGRFDVDQLRERFAQASGTVPSDIVAFVAAKLREHPAAR
jgi:hypothetical protein